MSTNRPSQLQLVRGIALGREQELAAEVGELMRQRAGAEATLTRLGGYLEDYSNAAAQGADTARMLGEIENERRFVRRLSQAMAQQRSHAERLAPRAGEKMELWQRARANLEALERVIERRESEQRRDLERRDQRDSDALTARLQSREAAP